MGLWNVSKLHATLIQPKYSRDFGRPRRPWPNAGRKKSKNRSKISFFSLKNLNYFFLNILFCIYFLVMPKYWGKQLFAHRRFPEVGQKQKTEREGKKTMVITIANLHMAHASRLGQHKLNFIYYTLFIPYSTTIIYNNVGIELSSLVPLALNFIRSN